MGKDNEMAEERVDIVYNSGYFASVIFCFRDWRTLCLEFNIIYSRLLYKVCNYL